MKSKEMKRKEAEQRQAEHDRLDWAGLLEKINSRPGRSGRERARHNF